MSDWDTTPRRPDEPDVEAMLLEAHQREKLGAKANGRPKDWQSLLIRDKRSREPRALLANAIVALRGADEWRGVLAFNEFSFTVAALKQPVFGGKAGNWTDHEDRLTADWLQHKGIHVSVEIAGQAVQAVARDRKFHPVREYLDGLRWDGTRRIDGWLIFYWSAQPTRYTQAIGARWLTSAVARIFWPGCKADHSLIVEGPQGLKKSTGLKIIAEPWFTDEIADLGSKDAALQTRGVWVVEIAELEAMTRSEVGRIKAFMSRSVDRFRPPYGRHLLESPRQCVFAGSVNHGAYLRDDTGARRFWPVKCGRVIRVDELARDRDQLWAEAVSTYRSGAPWWLDTVDLVRAAQEEQSERYEETAWDAMIQAWAAERLAIGETSVSVAEILDLCIRKQAGQWTHADEIRVARCLTSMGWERYRDRKMGMQRRYRPSDHCSQSMETGNRLGTRR